MNKKPIKLFKVEACESIARYAEYSMANAMPEDTGVENPIEIYTRVDEKHPVPQVAISFNKNAVFTHGHCLIVSIADRPVIIAPKDDFSQKEALRLIGSKTYKRLKKFIKKNKQLLLDYYTGKTSNTRWVLNNLQKVEGNE